MLNVIDNSSTLIPPFLLLEYHLTWKNKVHLLDSFMSEG